MPPPYRRLAQRPFGGLARTLADDPADVEERNELMVAARQRHAAETQRMRAEAATLRAQPQGGGEPGAALDERAMCFVRPVPAPAAHFPADDATMGASVAACGLCPSAGLHLIHSASLGQQAHGRGHMQPGHLRLPGMPLPFDDMDDDEDEEDDGEDEEGLSDGDEDELGSGEEEDDDMDVDAPPSGPPDRAAIAAAALARAVALQAAGAAPAPPHPVPPPAPHPAPPSPAPVARPSLGREAALAAAMARAAAARAEPVSVPIPPPQAPPPPPPPPRPQPVVRDAAAQRRADLAMAAAEARAAATGAGPSRGNTSPTRVIGGAWRPPGAVASAQDAAQAASACDRAASAQRVLRCRQLLEEDRSLRRFDPIMWPGGRQATADGAAGPSGSVAVLDPGSSAALPSGGAGICRVRIIRPDGSALTLRLPPGGTLAALRLAALSSWQVQTAGTVPSEAEVAQYGLVAHGGVELFGDDVMARTLAQAGLAGEAATLHLVHSRHRGVQARGVRPAGRGRHQQHADPDDGEEEEEEEDGGVDEVLAGLTGWVGPGALTYEQALEVAHRLGVVEVATAPAVVAGLRTAPWEGGADGSVVSAESRCLCCICQCDLGAGQLVTHLPCAHVMHEACAREWLGRATWCPLCKRRVGGN